MKQRKLRSIKSMQLPPAATPRPGDDVTWYVDSRRATGKFLGHGIAGQPLVLSVFNNQNALASFECLRITDPTKRVGGNWLLLDKKALRIPLADEERRFAELLAQRIPPGPTYMELVEEIWGRGYEVYVVGGTVRDVIAGEESNDVDLVTTMPINIFQSFFRSMFKNFVSMNDQFGYARLGGKGHHGDPFIDLKIFSHTDSGTEQARFGADFTRDVELRDFACNSIYYDPINKTLIDPTLRGLKDAEDRILSIVCNHDLRSPTARGQVAIRYFKFLMRGYQGEAISDQEVQSVFIPCIATLTNSIRLSYVRRQVFGKIPEEDHAKAIGELEGVMSKMGNSKLWQELFAPILSISNN